MSKKQRVTFFAGVLNLDTGHLRYCNAGHKAPFMLSDNAPCSTLTVKRQLPVGAMPDVAYTQQETTLAPSTTLFLYKAVSQFVGDTEQSDDLTMLVLQYISRA